jgi:hypothetical protein
MQNPRFQRRAAFVALAAMGISAAGLYFGGDHRNGLMTAGETVVAACLLYSASQRGRQRKS